MTKDSKGSGGPRDPRTLTRWIEAAERGDQSVLDELWRELEPELRKIAGRHLRCSAGAPSLVVTEVLSELFLSLQPKGGERSFPTRHHFYAYASQTVRKLIVRRARARGRREDALRTDEAGLDAAVDAYAAQVGDLLALDDELEHIARKHPKEVRIVEMRYFGGLRNEEIAQALGLSSSKVDRMFRWVKAELKERLR